MGKLSGIKGSIKLANATGTPAAILGVKKASWKETAKTVDSTSVDSNGYEEHIAGAAMKSATLDVTALYDTTETGNLGAPPLISAGQAVKFEDIPSPTDTNIKWSGDGTITDVSSEWDVESTTAMSISFTIKVNGDWTAPTPTTP
jgi:hypothetical protein